MVKVVAEELVNGRVRLKFVGLSSICPFTGREDRTDFELSYAPGQSFHGSPAVTDPKRLHERLASLESRKMVMEVVPMEILKSCIEDCASQHKGRRAAPEEAEISSLSFEPGKGKDWAIRASLKFQRKVHRIEC